MKPSDQVRQKIRDLREDRNLTQATMAEKLGMSETGYAKIERGQTSIRFERLQQIANILDVSLADLTAFGEDSVIACNHSDFSNSTHFTFAVGNPALETEITSLNQLLSAKNEIIGSREREIESLKEQISVLKQQIELLNKLVK